MVATALPLISTDSWPSSIAQAATPANRNSLRFEVDARPALSFEAAQPGAPVAGGLYVLSAPWGDEITGTLAYYRDGAWSYWTPYIGQKKVLGATAYTYTAGSPNAWIADPVASNVIVPVQVAASDETTNLTTGAAKATFRLPFAMTLLAGGNGVRASLTTAATGANLQVDINVGGVSILSTPITIDAGEKTSTTAATPPVVSTSSLADDAEVTIDIDQIGSTVAGAGLKVTLIGYKTP